MKTILITGGTDGIGKLAAISLARMGHTIWLHGRNQEKVDRVVEEVKISSSNDHVTGFIADFNDMTSVRAMAEQFKLEETPDVIINNAGIFKTTDIKNKSGIDIRFAVNYLAPYLFTNRLIQTLDKKHKMRIINLSSAAQSSVDLAALKGEKELSVQEAYAQSKLALTMWSFYLAQNNDNLNVIALNPGSLLNTKMVQEAYGQYWSSAEKGADIIVDLALSETYNSSSGKYFDNDTGIFSNAHPDAYDPKKVQELIETTHAIVLQ